MTGLVNPVGWPVRGEAGCVGRVICGWLGLAVAGGGVDTIMSTTMNSRKRSGGRNL
ncbi:hypothetical protein CORMATOL_01120 [Corynebacterium matruchotii ATCC 33806]|uniref:Uncharacterized protein n=1 Tax=Corynebacterium matruchotii ATCC 33806 TaxID=566549 RepID=C0E2B5_9CORY|nr:hypothetical protein CORMATOL_01120 [Corynebacterium matruchotii ATCC 33806]